MPKSCCVPSCKFSSKVKPKPSFHEFPSNIDLRNAWLEVISRKDFVPSDYSVVCSRHFKASDYIPHKTQNILKKGTVPSIFSDYLLCNQPQDKCERQILKRKSEENENVRLKKSKAMSPSKLEQANLLMDFHTSLDLHSVTAVTTIVPEKDKIKNKYTMENKQTQTKENKHALENQHTQTKITSHALIKIYAKVKRLQRLLAARNKKIYSLHSNLNKASEKLSYFQTDTHFRNLGKMKAMLDAGVATKQVEFVLNQVNNFDKTKPRWPDNILRECVLFHASSPVGYRHIQQKELLDLPCVRTLQRFLGPANGAVGFTSSTKEDLTEEANESDSREDWESLITNEIAITPQDIYNSNLDHFYGYHSETSDI